jgi:hypothetical protein
MPVALVGCHIFLFVKKKGKGEVDSRRRVGAGPQARFAGPHKLRVQAKRGCCRFLFLVAVLGLCIFYIEHTLLH